MIDVYVSYYREGSTGMYEVHYDMHDNNFLLIVYSHTDEQLKWGLWWNDNPNAESLDDIFVEDLDDLTGFDSDRMFQYSVQYDGEFSPYIVRDIQMYHKETINSLNGYSSYHIHIQHSE